VFSFQRGWRARGACGDFGKKAVGEVAGRVEEFEKIVIKPIRLKNLGRKSSSV
jgi:hypothetical protein